MSQSFYGGQQFSKKETQELVQEENDEDDMGEIEANEIV